MSDMGILEQVQRRTMKICKGLEHLIYEMTLRELILFRLEKRSLGWVLINMYIDLMGGGREDEDIFPVVPKGQEAVVTN